MHPEIPAVVVGGNLNGLGVVRSLARGGIPTYVIATSRDCPAAWSRHATFVRARSLHGDALLETLQRLASNLNCRPVLILTQDSSVLTVSAHRQQLEPHYHIELPDVAIVAMLSDKLAFDALAVREGFAVPRSCAVRTTADLAQVDEFRSPVILKPAEKGRVPAGAADRAERANTLEQARLLATRMLAYAPALIVQEWIEGADSEIFFTLFCTRRDGCVAGLFCGRKLMSNPPGVGSTAICIPAPEFAEALERETRQFLRRVPYRGLGSLEFKRDVRTQRFLMVEPTVGRTDWQEEIATLCGINLAEIAYWQALGQERPHVVPCDPRHRPAWRTSREFPVPMEFRSGTHVIDAHFRWNDPLPGVYFYAYERGARRIWHRARRELMNIFPHRERPH